MRRQFCRWGDDGVKRPIARHDAAGLAHIQARGPAPTHVAVVVLGNVRSEVAGAVDQSSLDGRGVLSTECYGRDEGTKLNAMALRIERSSVMGTADARKSHALVAITPAGRFLGVL